jgi:hypothetical protein
LTNLRLSSAAMGVLGVVEFASLHELHDDVEVIGVVVDLVYFNYVGMFQLNIKISTVNIISH